ncbi:thioredoxin [Saprospiraceae bacterium]|nr:thioredoxin [Saprospiraceae bacterium]MDG1433751.1 thioredoxin [Saprospiraceae bacterium]
MKEIKNIADFKSTIESGKPVLLDFYANWCGPCRALLPTVEKLAEAHSEDFEIVKINVDSNQELAQQFGVKSIPALFFLKDGEVQERLIGVQTEAILKSKIEHYS